MGRLKTLAPRLAASSLSRVKTLDVKAGSTARERGGAWMKKRERVALAHQYRCAGCGCVWVPGRDQIDHRVPLEQGGSNDEGNLDPLCDLCHKAKTAAEAATRAGRILKPL
jgi:5-methylcytosine-specific restriction endonuclease McrA